MAKTNKKKVLMPSGVRNKLMAAVAMLLVSSIMVVSSTYAWFTLSTAPEVKNISTTVAGNGSLEIALMPANGLLGSIKNGLSSTAGGGTAAVTTANTTWGNVIQLDDASYGLSNVTLYPAKLNTQADAPTTFADATKPLAVAKYGLDGRIDSLEANTVVKANADGAFNSANYGVRAIGELDDTGTAIGTTYGYVVDLAMRLNTTNNGTLGKLLLQTDAAQRIYADATNADIMGGGSYMSFDENSTGVNIDDLMKAIRVTFVQDYGKSGEGITPVILGTAKLDYANKTTDDMGVVTAKLYLYNDTDTKLVGTNAVLLNAMPEDAAQQISAIVWLDGTLIKNSSVSANSAAALAQATLNLQFSTDVTLQPSVNSALKQGS